MSTKKQQTQQIPASQEKKPQEEQKANTISLSARAYPVAGGGPVLANLTFDIGGVVAIRGAKLVDGKNGPFVSMPQRQTKDGYQEVVFPITKEMRELTNSVGITAYKLAMIEMAEKLEKSQQPQQAAPSQEVPELDAGPAMTMSM